MPRFRWANVRSARAAYRAEAVWILCFADISLITKPNYVLPAKAGSPYVDHKRTDTHSLRKFNKLRNLKSTQNDRMGGG